MPSEVAQILKTIEEHTTFQSVGSLSAETLLEKLLVGVAAVSLVLSIVLLFIEPLRSVGLLAGLVFLLAVVVLTLVEAFSLVAAVRRPLAGYAEAAQARLESRSNCVSALAVFSSEGLRTAKMALENDTGRMQRRLSMLVGAVEKVGFIPAGIALYYAALQASVVPPHVEYRLTPLGEEISHRVRVLADWIEVNLEEILEAGEPGEQA